MATIDPAFPQQSQAPDYTGVNAMAINALSKGASLIGNEVKKGIISDTAEDLTADIDEVYEAALDEPAPIAAVPGKSPEEMALMTNLSRLEAVVSQGSSSARANAMLKMQKTLEQATLRYPALQEELMGQYGHLVRVNPKLTELGMLDELSTQRTASAMKDIERIKDQAYGDVADGKFGMTPGMHPFGGEDFVRIYTQHAALREIQSTSLAILDTMRAQGQITAQETYNTLHPVIGGQADLATSLVQQTLAQATKVSEIMTKVQAGTPVPSSDIAYANTFRTEVLTGLKANLATITATLQDTLGRIPPEERGSFFADALQEDIQHTIEFVGRFSSAVDALQTAPDLMQAVSMEAALRTIEFKNDNPEISQLVNHVTQMRPLIENMDTLGGMSMITKSEFGNVLTRYFNNYMRTTYSLGTSTLNRLAEIERTPEDASAGLRRQRLYTQDPWNNGIDSPDGRSRGALATQSFISTTADKQVDAFLKSDIAIPQHEIASIFTAFAGTYQELTDNGNAYNSTDMATAKDHLNTPNLVSAAIKFRTEYRQDPDASLALQLVGKEATDWAYKQPGGFTGALGKLGEKIHTSIYGEDFITLVKPNFEDIDVGYISFEVDRERVKAAYVKNKLFTMGNPVGLTIPESEINSAYARVMSIADQNAKDFNRELQFVAHAKFFSNAAMTKPRYAVTYEEAGFSGVIPFSQGSGK